VTVPVALAGGVATTFAFTPTGILAFAILGPAVGLWAFARARTNRGGVAAGMAYGLAFTFVAYRWMFEVDLIAYVGLSLVQAVYWSFTGVVAARAAHLRPGWWVAVVTATWTLAETLRSRFPISGFEWGQLSLSTADTPLRPAAAIVGALGVTGVLVALAAGVAIVALDRRLRSLVPFAVGVITLAALVGFGSVTWTAPDGSLRVAVVQSDNPCPRAFAEDCPGYSDKLLENYVAGTSALPVTPDLILWGEDALFGGDTLDAVGQQFVDRFGPLPAPLLAGTATSAAPGRFFRQAALFDRDGMPLDAYAKRQPVPFGEYVPLRTLLGGISDVGRLVPSDMMPGRDASPVVLPTTDGPAKLGTVVSWEVTFSRLVRDVGRHANGLATLTTVSSYGMSSAPDQLLDAAQLRAAEQQKPMVVAATTGRSAVITPSGELVATTKLLEADSLTAAMPLRAGLTPFGRTGDVPVVLVAVVALALAAMRSGRAREAVNGAEPASPPSTAAAEPVDSAAQG
jgi:apolipoprotein N-acyltransferase